MFVDVRYPLMVRVEGDLDAELSHWATTASSAETKPCPTLLGPSSTKAQLTPSHGNPRLHVRTRRPHDRSESRPQRPTAGSRHRPVETREMLEVLDAGGAHDGPDRARDLVRKGHRARPGRPHWTSSQLGGHIARYRSLAVACPSCLHRRPPPASWQFRQVLRGIEPNTSIHGRWRAATHIWRSLIGPRSTGAASARGLSTRTSAAARRVRLASFARARGARLCIPATPTARRLRASAQGQA